MATKVAVYDVFELSSYALRVQNLKTELEHDASALFATFDSIRTDIATLILLTNNQGKNWTDPQYDVLRFTVEQCTNTVNSTNNLLQQTSITFNTKLAEIEQSTAYINKLVKQLGEITAGGSSSATNNGYSKHLSITEVSSRWEAAVNSIEEQIKNYREALNQRGVPNCKWLDRTLSAHRTNMMEQEAYNLDVSSGHFSDTVHNCNAYQYPDNYSDFYDQLTNDFRTFCASSTNPNYSPGEVNKWFINCQRCVPTYEMLRRGLDVTALPCDEGYDYLAYHPFSVWNNAQVISCCGQDQHEIESTMGSWGNGARAQITVMWTQTAGHTFIAEQRNGRTYYIDPQSGNENYTDWIDSAIPGRTQFCRIDNLDCSSLINHCYVERDEF